MRIDDELSQAADDLSIEISSSVRPAIPALPNRQSRVPSGRRLVLVVGSLALVGIGAAIATVRPFGSSEKEVIVATEPPDTGQPDNGQSDGSGEPADDATVTSVTPPGDDATVVTSEEDEITEGADVVGANRPEATTTDPTFGTPLTLFENTSVDGGALVPLPGGSPAFNADGSRILLYESGDARSHMLYDGESLALIRRLSIAAADIEQVYWDPVNPNRIFYPFENELVAYDVTTDRSTTVHQFEDCDKVLTPAGPRPISRDGQKFGFICTQGDDTELVAFNVGTGEEMRRSTPAGSGGLVPFPDGTGFVTRSRDGVVEVFDDQLEPTGLTFTLGTDGFALIQASDGRQLIVTTVYGEPADAVGSVVGFNLANGEATVAIGESIGDSYPPDGTRLAASPLSNGHVVVTIVGDPTKTGSENLDGKVIIVNFDSAVPTVTLVASHGAETQTSDIETFWAQPYPAVSSDGRTVLFSAETDDGVVTTVLAQVDR